MGQHDKKQLLYYFSDQRKGLTRKYDLSINNLELSELKMGEEFFTIEGRVFIVRKSNIGPEKKQILKIFEVQLGGFKLFNKTDGKNRLDLDSEIVEECNDVDRESIILEKNFDWKFIPGCKENNVWHYWYREIKFNFNNYYILNVMRESRLNNLVAFKVENGSKIGSQVKLYDVNRVKLIHKFTFDAPPLAGDKKSQASVYAQIFRKEDTILIEHKVEVITGFRKNI